MRHQLIGLLGCRIKGNRVVHLIICAERNFLIAAINGRRRCIHQMLHTPIFRILICFHSIIRMAAGFQNVVEAKKVGFNISIRVCDGITNTGLCCQVNDHIRVVISENAIHQSPVSNRAFYKSKVRLRRKFLQSGFFQAHIVVFVHIINADDFHRWNIGKQSLRQVSTDEACDAGQKNRFVL